MTTTKPKPKLYVAGASSEIERAERVILLLSESFEITHDWTKIMRAKGPEAQLTDEELRVELQRDYTDGVDPAEVLLVLIPSDGHTSTGAWFETSRAIAANQLAADVEYKMIVAAVPPMNQRVTPWVRLFASRVIVGDEITIAWLEGWAAGRSVAEMP